MARKTRIAYNFFFKTKKKKYTKQISRKTIEIYVLHNIWRFYDKWNLRKIFWTIIKSLKNTDYIILHH